MTIDSAVKLIEAMTKLFGALAWPVLVLFVLIRFGPALRKFAEGLSELTFKGAGFEASAKRQQAVDSLTAAVVARPEASANVDIGPKEARAAAVQVVTDLATPRAMRRAARSVVLWVDDRPNNNVHEREALEALGVQFVLAVSTDEALERIKQRPIDAIISDMGRPPDSQAGYTLLEEAADYRELNTVHHLCRLERSRTQSGSKTQGSGWLHEQTGRAIRNGTYRSRESGLTNRRLSRPRE